MPPPQITKKQLQYFTGASFSRTDIAFLQMLCNAGFDGFGVGTVYYVNLLSILEVMERRNRSDSFSLHQFRCIGRRITDNLQKNRAVILLTEFLKLWGNDLTRSAPTEKATTQFENSSVMRNIVNMSTIHISTSEKIRGQPSWLRYLTPCQSREEIVD